MEDPSYLHLVVPELILEPLVHQSTLVLGETLALVAHHLFHVQAFQRCVFRGFEGLDGGNVRTLGNGLHNGPVTPLTVHQLVTLGAVLGSVRNHCHGIQHPFVLDLLFQLIQVKLPAHVEPVHHDNVAGVNQKQVCPLGLVCFLCHIIHSYSCSQ